MEQTGMKYPELDDGDFISPPVYIWQFCVLSRAL